MIRKMLIFTVLAVAAAAAIFSPLWKSDAAQQQPSTGSPKRSASRALPNFDVRLNGRAEFDDMDLNSTSGNQAAMQNARALALELPQLGNSVRLSKLRKLQIFAQ